MNNHIKVDRSKIHRQSGLAERYRDRSGTDRQHGGGDGRVKRRESQRKKETSGKLYCTELGGLGERGCIIR